MKVDWVEMGAMPPLGRYWVMRHGHHSPEIAYCIYYAAMTRIWRNDEEGGIDDVTHYAKLELPDPP